MAEHDRGNDDDDLSALDALAGAVVGEVAETGTEADAAEADDVDDGRLDLGAMVLPSSLPRTITDRPPATGSGRAGRGTAEGPEAGEPPGRGTPKATPAAADGTTKAAPRGWTGSPLGVGLVLGFAVGLGAGFLLFGTGALGSPDAVPPAVVPGTPITPTTPTTPTAPYAVAGSHGRPGAGRQPVGAFAPASGNTVGATAGGTAGDPSGLHGDGRGQERVGAAAAPPPVNAAGQGAPREPAPAGTAATAAPDRRWEDGGGGPATAARPAKPQAVALAQGKAAPGKTTTDDGKAAAPGPAPGARATPSDAARATSDDGDDGPPEPGFDALLDEALSAPRTPARAAPAPALPDTPTAADVTDAIKVLIPAIRGCAGGESGVAVLSLVVSGDGRVRSARVEGAPFAGTAAGNCMEGVARRARFPRFARPTFRVQLPLQLR